MVSRWGADALPCGVVWQTMMQARRLQTRCGRPRLVP